MKKGLRLLTTHSKDTLFSQHMMDESGIAKAYISPKTASLYQLKTDQIAVLASEYGQIDVYFIIDDTIQDDLVMMHVGWWRKHGNPNSLTLSHESDLGGQVVYHETFVDIK